MEPVVKQTNAPGNGYAQNIGFGINILNQPVNDPSQQQFQANIQPQQTPQQPIYGYGNFANMVTPMPANYYKPTTFCSFSDYVNAVNRAQDVPSVGFNPSGLTSEFDYVPESVGLPMNGLIDVPEQGMLNGNADALAKFNNLVIQAQPISYEKFGIQPIPEDVDRSMLPKPMSIVDITMANSHLNNGSNQKTKKVNNWFTRLLEQRGDDYISSGKLTIDEVSKNAERILDDIIIGRIDYTKHGQYLIQPVIIETLINYCSNKLAINKSIQFALGYTYNDYTDKYAFSGDAQRFAALNSIDDNLSRNMNQAISIVNQDIGIYSILYERLSYVNATKNVSSLFSLTNDLNNYRKQIKKRY